MKVPLRTYWALLARYLGAQWRMSLLLAVLLLANIGLQLASPQVIRQFIDAAQVGQPSATLLRLALVFLGLALAQQAAAVAATYCGESVGWAATNELRAELAAHCLGLDLSFHNAHTSGEMIERIDGDVTALAGFFSQFAVQVLGNVLLLAGILVLLAREDWRVGLALSAFAAIALIALQRLEGIAVPHFAAERQASAELFGFAGELLAGAEDVRANGAKPYVMRRFYELMRALRDRGLRAGLMVNILMNALSLSVALGTAAAFAVSAHLYRTGALTIGTVYLVFRYTSMLEAPIRSITNQLQDLEKAGASIARIRELLGIRSRLADAPSPGAALPAGALAVTFRGVSFAYHDAPPAEDVGADAGDGNVVHDVSFELKPGTVLGLLGRTGSGKTTLSRLLFRLCDPDTGTITLGDPAVDVRTLPLAKLRGRIGLVTQSVQLFHGTVRDNLTLFDPSVPDARLEQVLEELALGEWVRSLPGGLDATLASGGGGLSAGEAQLLALARVFLQDPGLVILDEASSRLDPSTERLVERAVERLVRGGGRTAIIIAHRLLTVQRADEIMILEDGRICEHGSRLQLAGDPASRFYHLLQTGLEEVLA